MKKTIAIILVLALTMLSPFCFAFADSNEASIDCPRCSKSVPDDSNFCLYCGYPLKPIDSSDSIDYFAFSEPSIISAKKWGKPDKYIMDFKFTCLYPLKSDEPYPNTFGIVFSFLDVDEVAVKTGGLQVSNMLSYGDKVRASACPHITASENIITPEELAEIEYVKFTGFTTWTQDIGVKNYVFNESHIFPLD